MNLKAYRVVSTVAIKKIYCETARFLQPNGPMMKKGKKYQYGERIAGIEEMGRMKKVMLPIISQKLPRIKKRKPQKVQTEDFTWRRHLKTHSMRHLNILEQKIDSERRKIEQENWIKTHTKTTLRFTQAQLKVLRKWFEAIDADNSGEISVDELEDPLLSIGIVSNLDQVKQIVREVDADDSGTIGFEEFVHILTPPRYQNEIKGATYASESFKKLQDKMNEQTSGQLSVNTLLSAERRGFLIDAIISNIDSHAKQKKEEFCKREREAIKAKNTRLALNIRKKRESTANLLSSRQKRYDALETVITRNVREERGNFLSEIKRPPRRCALTHNNAVNLYRDVQKLQEKALLEVSQNEVQKERRKRVNRKSRGKGKLTPLGIAKEDTTCCTPLVTFSQPTIETHVLPLGAKQSLLNKS